ncbi:MAG TPA: DUF4249 family protein [Acidobacteriota bacterium]|nr:DUF4249 family protein [Acidobacteriota bacterium]
MRWLFGLLLLGAGCGTRNPGDLLAPAEVGTIVVDARLIVGTTMPPMFLRLTQSPTEPFDRSIGLGGALVEVVASTGDTIRYSGSQSSSSLYRPDAALTGDSIPAVLPNTTYSLRVVAPDGRVVTASTTTPDSFQTREWLLLEDPSLAVRRSLATYDDFPNFRDSVYYVESNQLIYQDGLLEARFDRGNALAFQVGLFSLDHGSPFVIDADFLDPEDLEDLERETSSPPFEAPDASIRLPWFAIFFEGRYNIKIYSVDRNWYDLARTLDFFGTSNIGFGGNAGDNFERPIFHVNGGIGLFGSAAMDEVGFTIHPKP